MKIRYSTFCFLFVFLTLMSCKKALDINKDPNNFTDVPANLLLPAAQVQLAYTLGGDVSRVPGAFVQHYAGHRNQPLEYNQYDVGPASTDGLWGSLYAGVLDDLKSVIAISRVSGDSVYIGISQLLSAETFGVLTDLYGDIPFSQALLNDGNITPGYDKQETIYPGLLAMIDAGISNVKSAKGRIPAEDDLIYGGDPDKWEKFGNSLKLRLLNHVSKRDPQAAIAFLNSNPTLISSNAENARLVFGESASNANPAYGFDVLSGRKDMAVASTIVNAMKQLSDPRVPAYFFPVANDGDGKQGEYFGNDPGNDTDDAGENLYSRIGPLFASVNSPVMIISYAEVQFLISEIRLRENKAAESATAYTNAVTADFDFAGVDGAGTYLQNPAVIYDNTLERIISQKWITLFQAPYEAWTDWRRTGFPALVPAAVSRTNGIIPRKLPYPQAEVNLNRVSLEQGPGIPVPVQSLLDKVWWDN